MGNAKSIRTPLLIVVVISSLIMLSGGVIALWSLGNVAARFAQFVEQDQARLQAYGGMYAQGLQTGQAIRNIILDATNPKAYKNLEAAQKEFLDHLQAAQTLANDTGEAGALADLGKRWAANTALKDRIRDLAKGRPDRRGDTGAQQGRNPVLAGHQGYSAQALRGAGHGRGGGQEVRRGSGVAKPVAQYRRLHCRFRRRPAAADGGGQPPAPTPVAARELDPPTGVR